MPLQSDIDKVNEWSPKWLLKFNTNKCHVLILGKFENIVYTHHYNMYDDELEQVFEEKDLGVTVDAELKFQEHISAKVKENSVVSLIRRSFSFLDCHFNKLYTTFVRPHLEYAQAVWAPHLIKHAHMIENVQIRATKVVDGPRNLSYTERRWYTEGHEEI